MRHKGEKYTCLKQVSSSKRLEAVMSLCHCHSTGIAMATAWARTLRTQLTTQPPIQPPTYPPGPSVAVATSQRDTVKGGRRRWWGRGGGVCLQERKRQTEKVATDCDTSLSLSCATAGSCSSDRATNKKNRKIHYNNISLHRVCLCV